MNIVETTYGAIEGQEKNGVLLFAGIPYAAPPVGPRRFLAPEPPIPWTDVRPATRFSAPAPQLADGGLTNPRPVRWSEDCLYLNITTPAADHGKRPVLFWIHGGGYRTGQGAIPWYNGTQFARLGDIVVVSINYRLGALGFTDLSALDKRFATSGANGILDQIAALLWVRDNIEAFGGDPARVTIAGESAGAFSVSTLLASPLATGLFQQAIAQSGAGHHTLSKTAGEQVAERFLDVLGTQDPERLQALNAETVLAAQAEVIQALDSAPRLRATLGTSVSPFYPVESSAPVPQRPITAMQAGAGHQIPLLTGTNRDETTLWGYGEVDDARLERMAEALQATATLATYRTTRAAAAPAERLIALTTDHMFRIPAARMLEARARHGARSYNYWFCWASRAFEGRLGATHALEIPFTFNNLQQPGVDLFLGPGPSPQTLADTMHAAWIAFIRDGDPGWPAYDLTDRVTQCFAEACHPVRDPDSEERQAWHGLRQDMTEAP